MVDDDDSDDESVFVGLDADDNEIWETPAEERESMISDSDSDRGFRETLSAFPSPQRTLSLSQLTHKSSLAR
jgi:predicted nuclease of predicted toxin-antitoxin system